MEVVSTSPTRDLRLRVEAWVLGQEVCPNKKQVRLAFPEASQAIVKAAIQLRQSREK